MNELESSLSLVQAWKNHKNWLPHPNAKQYSYNTDIILNNQYILRDNDSKLIVGFVDQECTRAVTPSDLEFIQNLGFDIDPSFVEGTIYQFKVTGLRLNRSSKSMNSYTSKWYASYDKCNSSMKNAPNYNPVKRWRNVHCFIYEIKDNQNQIQSSETVCCKDKQEARFFVVVGIKHCGGYSFSKGEIVTLLTEDDNPQGPNVIKVMVQEQHVGYVSRESAPMLREIGLDNIFGKCVGVYFRSCKFQLFTK